MLFLYYWIITFFVVIVSSLLIRSSILFVNDSWLEFILTLFSLWLVLLIISPLFIMFIDYDSILLSSLLVYSLGYQWSWSFNLNGVFNSLSLSNLGSEANDSVAPLKEAAISSLSYNSSNLSSNVSYINVSFDHFLVPSINYVSFLVPNSLLSLQSGTEASLQVFWTEASDYVAPLYEAITLRGFSLAAPLNYIQGLFSFNSTSFGISGVANSSSYAATSLTSYLVYFISLNTILLLPCYLGFRFLIFSFDVIHSLGFYSLGFKMDAIPGRINYSFELSTLFKGEHRGFCYELCGTSHSSMLILAMSL